MRNTANSKVFVFRREGDDSCQVLPTFPLFSKPNIYVCLKVPREKTKNKIILKSLVILCKTCCLFFNG